MNRLSFMTEMAAQSSCHGVSHFMRARRLCYRISWMFFTCLSAALCLYLLYSIIRKYLNYDVITEIRYIAESEVKS